MIYLMVLKTLVEYMEKMKLKLDQCNSTLKIQPIKVKEKHQMQN